MSVAIGNQGNCKNLVTEFPTTFSQGHEWITALIKKISRLVFRDTFSASHGSFLPKTKMEHMGQLALKHVWSLIPSLITVVLYFILVPLLLFFFLKDSKMIAHWFSQFLPKNRSLVSNVWHEVNTKIGCYVRGRVIEILIIFFVTWATFAYLKIGLRCTAQFAGCFGRDYPLHRRCDCDDPCCYSGINAWGLSPHCLYLLIAYAIMFY
jgi:Predicted permease